jgi:hypothetical protein
MGWIMGGMTMATAGGKRGGEESNEDGDRAAMTNPQEDKDQGDDDDGDQCPQCHPTTATK